MTCKEWIESAPTDVLAVLNSINILNAIEKQRRFSFQAPGMYDGAMDKGCKESYRRQYKAATELLEALKQTRPSSRKETPDD